MQIVPYDAAAAVAYAKRWALSRNPDYFDFHGIGGDCTNFVSQCIYAGARVMNYTSIFGWYYRSPSDRTPSWTGVEYLFDFLVSNSSVGPFGHEGTEREMVPGDIIQLCTSDGRCYHSLLVMARYPEILIATHSDDSLNRPLSTYSFAHARYIHIDGVRIW